MARKNDISEILIEIVKIAAIGIIGAFIIITLFKLLF